MSYSVDVLVIPVLPFIRTKSFPEDMLESQVLDIGTYVILLNEKEIDTLSVHSTTTTTTKTYPDISNTSAMQLQSAKAFV